MFWLFGYYFKPFMKVFQSWFKCNRLYDTTKIMPALTIYCLVSDIPKSPQSWDRQHCQVVPLQLNSVFFVVHCDHFTPQYIIRTQYYLWYNFTWKLYTLFTELCIPVGVFAIQYMRLLRVSVPAARPPEKSYGYQDAFYLSRPARPCRTTCRKTCCIVWRRPCIIWALAQVRITFIFCCLPCNYMIKLVLQSGVSSVILNPRSSPWKGEMLDRSTPLELDMCFVMRN